MKKILFIAPLAMLVSTLVGCNTEPNKYTVTWLNDDNTELEIDPEVKEGSHPIFDGITPTSSKTPETGYHFNFAGWKDQDGVSYTENYKVKDHDIVFTANYDSLVNVHNVKWINDNNEVIDTTSCTYGSHPTHADPEAKLSPPIGHHFKFSNWKFNGDDYPDDFKMPDEDIELKASYDEVPNVHTIHWINDNGEEIDTSDWDYGSHPTHDTPTSKLMPKQEGYHFTFTNWKNSDGTYYSETYKMPDNDVTFTAEYIEAINVYEITWVDDKGGEVGTTSCNYGETPTHADITKPDDPDEQECYFFDGWYDEKGIKLDGNYKVYDKHTFKANFKTSVLGGCTYGTDSSGNTVVTGIDSNYPLADLKVLDNYKGNNVVSIREYAFANNKQIQSIEISKNIKTFETYSFLGCTLKEVKYDKFEESSLTDIIKYSFFNTNLATFKAPKNLKNIGEGSFAREEDTLKWVDLSEIIDMVSISYPTVFGDYRTHTYTIYVKNNEILNKYKNKWEAYPDFLEHFKVGTPPEFY